MLIKEKLDIKQLLEFIVRLIGIHLLGLAVGFLFIALGYGLIVLYMVLTK
jgi:hypothetical protein